MKSPPKARIIAWSAVAAMAAIAATARILEAQQSAAFMRPDDPVALQPVRLAPFTVLDAGAVSPAPKVTSSSGRLAMDPTAGCLALHTGDGGWKRVCPQSGSDLDGGLWQYVPRAGDAGAYLKPRPGPATAIVVGTSSPDAIAPGTFQGQWDGGATDAGENLPGVVRANAILTPARSGTNAIPDPTPGGDFETQGDAVFGYSVYSPTSWLFNPGNLSQNHLVAGGGYKSVYIARTDQHCGGSSDDPHHPNAGHWVRFGFANGVAPCEDPNVQLYEAGSNTTSSYMSTSLDLTGATSLTFWEVFTRAGKSMQYTRSLIIDRGLPDETTVWSVAMGGADQADHQVTVTLPGPFVGMKSLTFLLEQNDDPFDPDGTADYRQGTLACRGSDDVSYPGCTDLPGGVTAIYFECTTPCLANCSGTSSSILQCPPQATPQGGDFECDTTTGGSGGQPMCWQPPDWGIDDVVISGTVNKRVVINVAAVHGVATVRDPGLNQRADEAGRIKGGYFEAKQEGTGSIAADGGLIGVEGVAKLSATPSSNYSSNLRGAQATVQIPAPAGPVASAVGLTATINSQANPDGGAAPDGGFKATTLAESVATHATIGRPTTTYRGLHVYAPTLVGSTPGVTEGVYIDDLIGLGSTVYGLYSAHTGAHYIAGTLQVHDSLRIDSTLSINGDTGTSNKVLHGGSTPAWSLVNIVNDTTGTLTVARGGTGATTLTNHGVLLGQGTSAIAATAAGATGTVLVGSGASADPAFSATPTVTGLTTSGQPALIVGPYGTSAGNTGELRFKELAANGTDAVLFKAPDSIASSTTYTLPGAYPASSGYVLSSTTAGVLSWASPSAGSGTVTDIGSGTPGSQSGSSGLTFSADPITGSGTIALASTIPGSITWHGVKIGLAYGGTNADLSATGGTGQVLKQSSSGAAITVGTLAASDVGSGAALTETDDTNVTLTLGGSPTSALLAAASLTLGWTGNLSVARGGSGAGTFTLNGVLYGSGTSAFGVTSQGTANSILIANAGAPSFSQTPIINTSLQVGVASSQTGSLKLAHASSANLTTIQAGNASSAITWTWPIADGSSGDCMKTNASGVLSFGSCITGAGTIGGSIASTQVAYGSGSDTIAGSSTLTYDGSSTLTLAASTNTIAGGIFKNSSNGANALGYVEAYNDQVHGYLALVSHSSGYTTTALRSVGYIQAGDSLTNGLWLGTLANAPIKFLINTTGTNNETFRIGAGKSMAISSRFEEAQGANVASANTLTLGTDGSYFKVTGTTTIKGITTANWQAGSRITLDFTGAPGPTVNHNDGTPGAGAVAILLAGAANMTTAARTTLDLRYDGTNWIEVSRNAGAGGGLSGLTANGAVYPTSSSAIASTAALTNGQVLIGSTSSTPVAATITAGTNVTVTNGAGTITIAATGGSGINSGITDPPMLTLPGSGMTFSDEFTAFSGWTFSGQAVASGSVNPTSAFTSGTSAGVYDVATRSGWLLVQPGTIATSTITQFARTDVTLPTNCTIVARLGTMTNIVHSATDDAAIFLSLDDQTVSSTKSVYAGSAGLTGLEIGIRILSNATGGVGYWFTTHAATLGNELNTTALRQELRGTIIVALIKKSTQYWGYVGDGTNWIYLGTTTAITNTMSRLKIEMLTPQANASDPNAIFSIDFIRVYDGTSAPNNVVWF